jgi:CRP/FNR family cyclic AMP-dependent transcriptional regulator
MASNALPSANHASAVRSSQSRAPTRDDLASVPWLGLIEAEHQARVVADLRVIDAQPGEVLCRVGRAAVWWLGVIDGLLKMSNDSTDGLPITFTGITSGGWFGEGTVLKNEVYRYNIQALRPSVVAGIPTDTFYWLLGRSIAFNRFVMNQLNERLGQFIAAREIDRLRLPRGPEPAARERGAHGAGCRRRDPRRIRRCARARSRPAAALRRLKTGPRNARPAPPHQPCCQARGAKQRR